MSNTTTTKASGEQIEGRAQIGIMLVIGLAGAAASFTHVHDVAAAHGQAGPGGWLAWADAVVLELMSIASGLEMRRRKRGGHSTKGPFLVLLAAVGLSLSAQILEAEPTPIGWVAASVPALGFLAMAKMALGRKPSADKPSTVAAPVVPVAAPLHATATVQPSTVAPPAVTAPATQPAIAAPTTATPAARVGRPAKAQPRARAAAVLSEKPNAINAVIAKEAEVSERTVRRAKSTTKAATQTA